jgi:hypothetical protein
MLCAACGETEDDGSVDASPQDTGGVDAGMDAGIHRAEIGTGVDGFEPLTTGQDVMLTQGPQGGGRQGGFHIWHAVRTRELNPEALTMAFHVYSVDTREELAAQTRMADLQPDGTGGYVIWGVAPPFPDCCQAANQDVIMHVLVTDADGMTGEDERTIHALACRDNAGTDLCP